ncbi:hypothetical protein PCASD_09792 [Puccinia coronata f. sp. avenae]|uniref:Cytochrome P450 n=1 Tax=Puccinia coronata f. sp. avenae TaxID=200324 RepID=A0A2N5U9T6_9BASI|nr:hypothetical protein PCASD_09792 [Puccinia coronata f. sp. avenae]
MPSDLVGHIFLGAIGYFMYLLLKYHDRAIGTTKKNDSKFPEIPAWPILGQIPNAIANFSQPLELGMTRHLKYRPGWSMTMPGLRIIDVSKPEWLEHVQKTNFLNYVKGSLYHSVMTDVFGNGILVTDGTRWKKNRHILAPLFSVKSFQAIKFPSLLLVVTLASENRPTLDICDVLLKFTLNFIVHATLGKDLGQLDRIHLPPIRSSSPSPNAKFAEDFDYAQNQMDFRFAFVTFWKVIEKVHFRLGRKIKSACDTLNQYATSLINERMAKFDLDAQKDEESPTDLLGFFLKMRKEMGDDLGEEEIRDALVNLIIAGRDSTGEALSWAFYHLLMNQDLVAKIREEASIITSQDRAGQVTYGNNKEFKWAHAVILETLRLHPSIPKNIRFALKADKIPDGPVIEAGDAVRWSDWSMGRDPDLWGEDCLEFKPSRWIDEKGNIKQFGQFKYHAFNAGPRICLGMTLGIFQCVSLIVEVFHKFEVEFAQDWLQHVPRSPIIGDSSSSSYLYHTPKYKPSLTLPMAQPMLVTIKPYQG